MPEPSSYVRVIGVDSLPPPESYAVGDIAVIRGTPDMFIHDGHGWNYAGMSGTNAMLLDRFMLAPGMRIGFADGDGMPRAGLIFIVSENQDNTYPGGFVGWFVRGTARTYLRGHSFTGGWRLHDQRDPGSGYFRMWIQASDLEKPLFIRNASAWGRMLTIYVLPNDPRFQVGG